MSRWGDNSWGGPPGPRGTPPSRSCQGNQILDHGDSRSRPINRRQAVFGLTAWIAARLAKSQSIDAHTRDYWNGKFKDPKTAYRRQPSPLLVASIRDRKPGTAIDLGMGDGRNAVYMALQGWQVTGVDLSDVAVGQAKQHAAAAGVKLDAVIDNLDHYDLGHSRWDLITLFYVHARTGHLPRSAVAQRGHVRHAGPTH